MSRSDERRPDAAVPSGPLAAAVLAVLVVATLGAGVGTVAAGDRVAVIEPSPSSVEAAPGETVTVEVTMASDGGYDGAGVGSIDFVAQYHPEYLEITDVEAGPWLADEGDADVVTERRLAHERGTAVLEQRRAPMDEGTTGTAVVATLTVEIAADAPPSTATIDFGESRVEPPRGWPLSVDDRAVTVAIDGGGDDAPAFDHPDPDDLETSPADESDAGSGGSTPEGGVATSGGANDAENGDDDETTPTDGDDAVPGLPAPFSAAVAVGTAVAVARYGGDSRH